MRAIIVAIIVAIIIANLIPPQQAAAQQNCFSATSSTVGTVSQYDRNENSYYLYNSTGYYVYFYKDYPSYFTNIVVHLLVRGTSSNASASLSIPYAKATLAQQSKHTITYDITGYDIEYYQRIRIFLRDVELYEVYFCVNTPLPTNTPMPTGTPLPTNTAMPTNTPVPTNTPLPPQQASCISTFSNKVNIENQGNNMVKVGGAAAWDAGAISTGYISGDGYAEILVDSLIGYRMAGFNNADSTQNWTDLDYAFYLAGSIVQIRQSGSGSILPNIPLSIGDKLRIWRNGSQISYWRLPVGESLWLHIYDSLIPSSGNLYLDSSIYSLNSQLAGLFICSGTPPTATPTHTPIPPTATPYPTNTAYPPLPTATPYPTNTAYPPLPTATPYPTNTAYPPLPTATPYPTFTPASDISFSTPSWSDAFGYEISYLSPDFQVVTTTEGAVVPEISCNSNAGGGILCLSLDGDSAITPTLLSSLCGALGEADSYALSLEPVCNGSQFRNGSLSNLSTGERQRCTSARADCWLTAHLSDEIALNLDLDNDEAGVDASLIAYPIVGGKDYEKFQLSSGTEAKFDWRLDFGDLMIFGALAALWGLLSFYIVGKHASGGWFG